MDTIKNINFNRAATSGEKPEYIINAAKNYIEENSFNQVGRGSGCGGAEAILETRIAIADLVGLDSPMGVAFTSGATESLNMLINGLAYKGVDNPLTFDYTNGQTNYPLEMLENRAIPAHPHIVFSCYEHNAVIRPVYNLVQRGLATAEIIHPDLESLKNAFNGSDAEEKILILNNASNVFGNILPIEELFAYAKKQGAYTIVDVSQTLGHIDVKMSANTDAIAFTGHKGLKGLQGSGGIIVKKDFAKRLSIWKAGGTGSGSDSFEMPLFMPDKFEAGTPNNLGIYTLGEAARAIQAKGIDAIRQEEMALFEYLLEKISTLPVTIVSPHIEKHGKILIEEQIPVLSITVEDYDLSLLASDLSRDYGIQTRIGLHCAPFAHISMGTMPQGTMRISLSSTNTKEEIDELIRALGELL